LGGDWLSSFFKLRFSGVASSGAESTSKSDSGELGGPVRAGDKLAVRLKSPATLGRGLLGDPDSEPVSWSVSFDKAAPRLETARKYRNKGVMINHQLSKNQIVLIL